MAVAKTARISAKAARGIISSRPHIGLARAERERGLQPIALEEGRGLLLVPEGYQADRPAALIVLCHGAGGEPTHLLGTLQGHAQQFGFLALAPKSKGRTWDVIEGGFGRDVAFIDR